MKRAAREAKEEYIKQHPEAANDSLDPAELVPEQGELHNIIGLYYRLYNIANIRIGKIMAVNDEDVWDIIIIIIIMIYSICHS